MREDSIVLWMKKYSFSEVLKWIQCTCIHPDNQVYQIRFEKLICLLMNIDLEEFEGESLTRTIFSDFISKYYESSNDEFLYMEDFVPYNQRKKIPYYINERKRYFYYGALERPYENLSKFDYLYSNIEIDNNLKLGDILNHSLNFQNSLLTKEEEINEVGNKINCIYVPTENYVDTMWVLFKVKAGNDLSIKSNFTWSIVKYDASKLIGSIDRLYINDENNNKIFIIPQLHLEILFNIAKNIIDSDKIKEKVNENVSEKFQDIFNKNIPFYKRISSISYNKQEILENKGVFHRVDEEILLVFYLYKVDNQLISLDKNISEEFEKLLSYDEIVLNYNNIKSEKILVSQMKIIPVVVYENLLINGRVTIEHQKVKFNHCELQDLISFLDILELNELYKYFNEEMLIEEKFQVVVADKIDKFGYYIENNKSFFEHGQLPKFIYIEPHMWSNYYMNYIYEKYSEKIFDFINNEKPNYFNLIKKIDNDKYECMNKSNLEYWTVLFKGENKVIIRYIKPALFVKSNSAIKLGEDIIKPLFLEYIDKLYEEISLDFQIAKFSFGSKYYIEMVPIELIDNKIKILKEYVSLISEENPIIIRTLYNNKDKSHHTFIIYDSNNMVKIFDSEKNYGERYCINQLIYSLALYNFPDEAEHNLIEFSKELTNKYCPIAKRRYGICNKTVFNPKIHKYSHYIKTNNTEISIVNREIAENLSGTALKKGEYKGTEANKICEMILNYLNEQLRLELSKYNESILNYSYRELEYVEATRSKNNMERTLDLETDTDFDVIEKAKDQFEENSQYSLGIKYIIHAIMKYGCNGRKSMSEESWKRVLAISFVTNEMALIYDMVKYNLQTYEVEVTELFEVKDNLKELIFSGDDYSNKLIEHKLKKDISKENAKELLENIDRIYVDKFGFKFYDVVNILQLLGEIDLESNSWNPITYISIDRLISEIKIYFKELDFEYINKVIRYVSLDFNTYNDINYITHTNLMRMKQRINLSPLLIKGDKVIYGNEMCLKSAALWISYYYNGDVPYTIDLPEEIKKEVKSIHRRLDLELEEELEWLSKRILGENYVEANIDNFRRISSELKAKPSCGEIDLLAVNVKTKTIFVIDAKNINKRLRPYDINQELNEFYNEKKGYLLKLNKKAEYITENIKLVLEYFKVESVDGWNVKKSFYVDKIFPSAFVREDIVFITKMELEEYLRAD
ncbi:hypothetical protein [Clostridium sp.]|uniref:hypothetical protein n=1 Tax=Clostridium sp. TaxID=1506 RepID=UPI001B54CC2E|nr:hypothetical protein [Clostridium sp.]MBP3916977.1 hypothetical protein [Clostridium sp.]